MADFDYMASGELFVPQGRAGLRYRRYERAAEAVRYAIEKLPPDLLAGTRLEVGAALRGQPNPRPLR